MHSLRIMSYNLLADLLVSLSVRAAQGTSQHVPKVGTPASEYFNVGLAHLVSQFPDMRREVATFQQEPNAQIRGLYLSV